MIEVMSDGYCVGVMKVPGAIKRPWTSRAGTEFHHCDSSFDDIHVQSCDTSNIENTQLKQIPAPTAATEVSPTTRIFRRNCETGPCQGVKGQKLNELIKLKGDYYFCGVMNVLVMKRLIGDEWCCWVGERTVE